MGAWLSGDSQAPRHRYFQDFNHQDYQRPDFEERSLALRRALRRTAGRHGVCHRCQPREWEDRVGDNLGGYARGKCLYTNFKFINKFLRTVCCKLIQSPLYIETPDYYYLIL